MYQQLIRIEGQEDILVSFAGELFYAKRETILRVCQDTRTNPTWLTEFKNETVQRWGASELTTKSERKN